MSEQEAHRNKKPSTRIWIAILAAVTVVAVAVTIWAVFFRQPSKAVLAPDYAPQETEQNAEEMEDSGAEKLDAPEGGGSMNLMFQDDVTIELGTNTATFYYGNPAESTQDVLLQIVIQDTLIAQSGLLTAGHEVRTLTLEEGAADTLQPGGYDGKLILSFYHPQTGEKANVNTEIPVSITVKE